MIGDRRVLGVITARGGSKGLPRKNVLPVGGKPLIAWTIAAAHGSRYLDRTVLSTDDPEISEVARAHGCEVPFVRPAELATDQAPGIAPVLHCLEQLPGYDLVALLQPTSPLRLPTDIDACLELLVARGAPAVVTVTEVEQHPYWMFRLAADHRLQPLLDLPAAVRSRRRQEQPAVYVLNGAVYVADTGWLRRNRDFQSDDTLGWPMPRSRSLDVDTAADLALVEQELGQVNHHR